jgi:hypothetical protein
MNSFQGDRYDFRMVALCVCDCIRGKCPLGFRNLALLELVSMFQSHCPSSKRVILIRAKESRYSGSTFFHSVAR